MGSKDGIWALRLGFGPQGWNLGLKAEILALRLGSESEGGGMQEEKKEKEKISHMFESIHPFGAAAQKREMPYKK